MNEYIINDWAIVRRNEMVMIPQAFKIHSDFLQELSETEFDSAFRLIWDLCYQIMTDISNNPEQFGMPMPKTDETPYGAAIAQEARYAAWRPMKLMNLLLKHGILLNDQLFVDINNFRRECKIKNVTLLFSALSNYGYVFEGLKNNKFHSDTTELTISYPDNPKVIPVLYLVARKAQSIGRDVCAKGGIPDYFCEWNYRLLLEGFGKFSYDDIYHHLVDKMQDEANRQFIAAFHKEMKALEYDYSNSSWNEGPGICYGKKHGSYLFRVISWKGNLQVMLRIRNANKCFAYLDDCPESVKDMFRESSPGCANRYHGCDKGVRYIFEDKERWKCGCCNAPFIVSPKTEDIPHYIRLVELGVKR